MAISGLHIGLAAGLGFVFFAGIASTSPWLLRNFGRMRVGTLGGLGVALAYGFMAGLQTPTQRALIMSAVAGIALLAGRRVPLGVVLSVAAIVVVAAWPPVLLTQGFWLSFGAVGVLFYAFGYRAGAPSAAGTWWKWGRPQGVIALGLAPMLLGLFGSAPLFGLAANAVAVPWVSFVTVPTAVLGAVLVGQWTLIGETLLRLSEASVVWLWPVLELAADWSPDFSLPPVPLYVLGLSCLGVCVLLIPSGVLSKTAGCALLIPLLGAEPFRPAPGGVALTMLDVGQGLSVVVETATSVLVYDTGARFGSGFDAGEAVVVPFLRAQGWRKLDGVILSHGDIDHVGGYDALRRRFPLGWVATNAKGHDATFPCLRGNAWHADGVRFEILHPSDRGRWSPNDGSCVLAIDVGMARVLLTGDIEVKAERHLLDRYRSGLRADVLVVPHHGSDTSSSRAFLQAVQPKMALISSGYRNRYKMPHPPVLQRLRAQGTEVWRTDRDGAVTVRISPQGALSVSGYRERKRRYWHR